MSDAYRKWYDAATARWIVENATLVVYCLVSRNGNKRWDVYVRIPAQNKYYEDTRWEFHDFRQMPPQLLAYALHTASNVHKPGDLSHITVEEKHTLCLTEDSLTIMSNST